jgi:hypothetical protein
MSEKLLLHERTLPDGRLEKTWLEVENGLLFFCVEGQPKAKVSQLVLEGVMRRYGKPLADEVAVNGPRLDVDGCTLSILRYRPRYDVIAKDYLVYHPTGGTPLAELATAVTGALAHLLRAR